MPKKGESEGGVDARNTGVVNRSVVVGLCSPHPQNYQQHDDSQIADLRLSLRRFGQVRSIVVQDDGAGGFLLVAGHGLHKAARLEGFEALRADVIPVDWAPARVLAYLAADNELARRGTADEAQLAALVQRVQDEADAELARLAAGGEESFKEMLARAKKQKPDPGSQLERADELQEKWQVQRGQIWTAGDHRLGCGDSTDLEFVSNIFEGKSPWMGLTSPPYWVNKEYEKAVTFSEHLDLLEKMYSVAWHFIEPGGFFFVNFDDIASQSMTKGLTGVDGQCIYTISADHYRIARSIGWALYASRVWLKPFNRLQQPFWTYKTSIPHHQEYEWLWTWIKDGEDAGQGPGEVLSHPDDWAYAWTWRKAGTLKDRRFDWNISVRSVWDTRNEAVDDFPLTRHVVAFPVCLPERALRAHSLPRALIWEPFCGSGTTIVASENLDRVCVGCELNESYCAAILERLQGMGLEPRLAE